MNLRGFQKRGQVTIFVILAILMVGLIFVYFFLRGGVSSNLTKEIQPVYDYYLSCLEGHARQGISTLGEQAGYIYVEDLDFVAGSDYRPFSSQLDFFGQPVPYWMYVSGNNILSLQKPSLNEMENQLERYVSENLQRCNFDKFYSEGYDLKFEEGDVKVQIEEGSVEVLVKSPVRISFEDQISEIKEQEFSIKSKLGEFYDLASTTYNYQMTNMFLETYALDVLRLYAPVDGVELTCSPKVYNKEEIKESLKSALNANVGSLKLKGDYYDLSSEKNKYFVTDIGKDVSSGVNFIYSTDWPTNIEIEGKDVVEPVGLQQGMGLLGFCYVPYKFVYDINFPVMIQFYEGEDLFQFPIAVIINKNQAREAILSYQPVSIESELCKYKNQEMEIITADLDLNPVEAKLRFKCLSSTCDIGDSILQGGEAIYQGGIPQCVNGFILASSEGYADAKEQISSNVDNSVSVILKKKYNLSLDLGTLDSALVIFSAEDYSTSVFYPQIKNIELVESYYNISVYVYRNSSLVFPGTEERKCVNVPVSGVGGIFGLEEEECFDVSIPSIEIESALVGGGMTQEYMTQGQLEDSIELNINVPLFSTPKSLEELQQNYMAVEEATVYIDYE